MELVIRQLLRQVGVEDHALRLLALRLLCATALCEGIGGRYHDKVFGGAVPGPIWKAAMTGALKGQPAPPFNSVHIPDAPKDKDKDRDRGKPGDGRPDPQQPWPGISIPPDLIGGGNNRGQGNGGGGNGGNWP